MSGKAVGTAEQLRIVGLLNGVLDRECISPVQRQIAIELLTVFHVARMTDKWEFVADSMNKHIKQIYRSLDIGDN
jgi:hypothetical protein